ncbi:MAG: hypothetical protein A2857_06195 [Candidatus Levybacteria bacterium RIFCSPHIGHO2_01_FULL_36_15]|nr:MAG: hypothetical protein A2857_06195 [Candidatus Levybacteria bacterium RIFCSPHIGHO2_01_FULL_36_15]
MVLSKARHFFIISSRLISDPLLDNPFLFNYIRFFLAGRQKGMKHFIRRYLKKYQCKTIADFCCGTGDFASIIPETAEYIGWDLNEKFIHYSMQRYNNDKNKQFIKANIMQSPKIYSRKFDAVLLISTIHHFSDKDLRVLLPKVNKITKKIVIIADIIPDPPHRLQRFFASIDRGRYVRPTEEKILILKKYFKIIATQSIQTGTAVQFGIICKPKK